MNEDGARALDRLVSEYRGGRGLVLLFDYDGTLAPIVEHPAQAVLTPGKRRLLQRLTEIPRLSVGVLSGRSLTDVRGMVGLADLYYAGTSGMEMDLRGRSLRHPKEKEGAVLLESVARSLEDVLPRWPGAWIERKPVGLTVHYRALQPDGVKEFLATVERALAPRRSRISTVGGPMAIEILPRDAWTKAVAARAILDHAGQDAPLPVFVGNDANDAEAFAFVAARGGVTIGVGPDAPAAAQYRLPHPGAVENLLSALLDGLTADPKVPPDATKPG